jgi:hypothetical protein
MLREFRPTSIPKLEDRILPAVLRILHICRPSPLGIGYVRLFARIPPHPPLLFQFLGVFALLPEWSLAPAGNKIQGLARRHCELLALSSFTRPGSAYLINLSIPQYGVYQSASV